MVGSLKLKPKTMGGLQDLVMYLGEGGCNVLNLPFLHMKTEERTVKVCVMP